MASLNKVLLIGNLGKDPDSRVAESGNCVCHMRIATSEWRSNGGDKGENQTEWHNIVAFGRLAEISRDHLKKGRKIFVEGRLHTRTYQKDNGPTQWYTEIVASEIRFLDSATVSPDETKANADAEF